MSSSPRITNVTEPKGKLTRSNYRKRAFECLKIDFQSRCAYSLVHFDDHANSTIEVDHHDPRKKQDYLQEYLNLVPSHSHCNLCKGNYWPNPEQKKNGQRLLNPRKEADYDEQLVECIDTGELIGLTKPAECHIWKLGLNRPWLCANRKKRTRLHQILSSNARIVGHRSWEEMKEHLQPMISEMYASLKTLIPLIKAATSEQIGLAVSKRQITGPNK